MKTITSWKFELLAGLGLATLLVGCNRSSDTAAGGAQLTAQEIAGKSRDAYAALSSYRDSGTVVYEMAGQNIKATFNICLQRPNGYRIDWTQGTGLKGVVWSAGSGDYLQITPGSPATPEAMAALGAAGQGNSDQPQKMPNMKKALTQASALSYSAASTIPGAFFNQDLGDLFMAPAASGHYPLQKEKDAKAGGVACYVLSSEPDSSTLAAKGKSGTATTTLWIGKKDFLIHQCRTKYVEKMDAPAPPTEQAIDEAIKKALEMQNKPATPEAIAAMRPQMQAVMKQVQSTLKAGFASGLVLTQTHKNIALNEKLSPAAFTP